MKKALILLLLTGCAAAPGSINPNCIAHCVISQVDAPEAKTVTATQNGATSVSRSASVGGP
jgi:hypothetical protein